MKYKVLIVLAKFYEDLSKNLIFGAKGKLKGKTNIKIIEVPGSFEIPVVISKNIKKQDGFVALGSIIKGETPHFDFISQSVIDAIIQLSINSKKPIGKFEVLASLESKYGLKYKIDSGTKVINPTGFKKNYYSKSRKADLLGYKPKYSSLDTISEELPYFLKNQESC